MLRATTACTFSTSQFPKVVREWFVLYILTSKRASRHNGVHFFDISTSKSGPKLVCSAHFGLGNVLRATTACSFSASQFPKVVREWFVLYILTSISTSQLPKVVRSWCVLHILTWKCASRHNGVHFFISHLARWLRTRCFSEPTFRLSYLFAHLHLLSSDSSLLSSSLFYSSLLSASSPSLLFICPYCRKFDF